MTRFHIVFVCDDGVEPSERASRIAHSINAFSDRCEHLCVQDHHCLTVACASDDDARVCQAALLSHLDDCVYDRDSSEHVVGFNSY